MSKKQNLGQKEELIHKKNELESQLLTKTKELQEMPMLKEVQHGELVPGIQDRAVDQAAAVGDVLAPVEVG